MAESTIQQRLGRPFDPAELRRIKRLWVRHSIAEDRRDIDGLIATLGPDCVYEIVPTGQRWEGHAGARAFYTELFAAFPDNAFALSDIVIGPQGVMEVATLTGTNSGPWAGAAADRAAGLAAGPDPVPVGPRHGAVLRGADLVRPGRDRRGVAWPIGRGSGDVRADLVAPVTFPGRLRLKLVFQVDAISFSGPGSRRVSS